LNFDADVAFGDQKAGPVLNATNPDLRSFRANGGKLIQYLGWGDPAISPLSSIAYYDSVRAFLDKYPDARHQASSSTQEFYRLFMVPGMGHCGGGVGANSFGNGASPQKDADHDVLSALERWVETGVARSPNSFDWQESYLRSMPVVPGACNRSKVLRSGGEHFGHLMKTCTELEVVTIGRGLREARLQESRLWRWRSAATLEECIGYMQNRFQTADLPTNEALRGGHSAHSGR
jgi:hypothetical protein